MLFRRCILKKLATVSTLTVVLVACSSAISYSDDYNLINSRQIPQQRIDVLDSIPAINHGQSNVTMMAQIASEALQLKIEEAEKTRVDILHQMIIKDRIKDLRKYVNKTWYVFSGSTPRGWDCSGLVVWFYKDLGIEIPHSATKQGRMKPKVKKPTPGDIVVTKYKNSKNFIHSGIYIGNNKMIHSGFKPGQRTEVISLDDPAFDNQKHYFVRVIGD